MKRAPHAYLALALLVSPRSAGARPTPGGAQEQCEDSVRYIAATLNDDARRTRVWYWSWMAAGTALLAGQATYAALVKGDLRTELVAGAATSVFIPAFLLLHPPAVLADAPLLDARLAATTVAPAGADGDRRGTIGDPCIALARARELLARDADDESFATGWLAHSFVIGGNIAVGLLLGIGFHDWWGAAKQAVGGSAVGELQILTLPDGARDAIRQTAPQLGLAVLGPGPQNGDLGRHQSTYFALTFAGTF